jgi:hypothetical protein
MAATFSGPHHRPVSKFEMVFLCTPDASTFFTGIRMHIVNGMAHLIFYCEQPAADGSIEFLVVARMVRRSAAFKGSLDRFASQFRRPMSTLTPGRPLN